MHWLLCSSLWIAQGLSLHTWEIGPGIFQNITQLTCHLLFFPKLFWTLFLEVQSLLSQFQEIYKLHVNFISYSFWCTNHSKTQEFKTNAIWFCLWVYGSSGGFAGVIPNCQLGLLLFSSRLSSLTCIIGGWPAISWDYGETMCLSFFSRLARTSQGDHWLWVLGQNWQVPFAAFHWPEKIRKPVHIQWV